MVWFGLLRYLGFFKVFIILHTLPGVYKVNWEGYQVSGVEYKIGMNFKWGRISNGEEYHMGKIIKWGRISSREDYQIGKNIEWGRNREVRKGMRFKVFIIVQAFQGEK